MPPFSITRALVVLAATLLQGCSDAGTAIVLPTAPTPPSNAGARLQATCADASLLIGQRTVCTAVFGNDIGAWTGTTWSVTPPDLVTFELLGAISAGQKAGTGTLTATYAGQSASVPIEVRAEDGLILSSSAIQSSGTAGSTAMIWLGGYYAVTSGDRGGITIQIRNATGQAFAAGGREVPRGGGRVNVSLEFTLPTDTPQVCASAVLIVVGHTRIEAPTDWPDYRHCIQIR